MKKLVFAAVFALSAFVMPSPSQAQMQINVFNSTGTTLETLDITGTVNFDSSGNYQSFSPNAGQDFTAYLPGSGLGSTYQITIGLYEIYWPLASYPGWQIVHYGYIQIDQNGNLYWISEGGSLYAGGGTPPPPSYYESESAIENPGGPTPPSDPTDPLGPTGPTNPT